jgi:hypothetical protein
MVGRVISDSLPTTTRQNTQKNNKKTQQQARAPDRSVRPFPAPDRNFSSQVPLFPIF